MHIQIKILKQRPSEHGSVVFLFILLLVLISSIASISALVIQTLKVSQRRSSMVQAMQFAEGGAAVAASELEVAYNSLTGSIVTNLSTNSAGAYTRNSSLSTSQTNVYERTITSPFTNQSVTAQIWMTNSSSPSSAKVVALATVNSVTQSAAVEIAMRFGFTAAIISDNPGNSSTSTGKSMSGGNVCINGSSSGPLVIDGGNVKAVWANGRCNYDTATVTPSAISMTNYNTATQVPDYTVAGSTNQLFDFSRMIAVADVSGTHFGNLSTFWAKTKAGGVLEGVIVVDIKKTDSKFGDLNPTYFPFGINIRGTLIFNFDSTFAPTDKIFNTANMNINPADLSGLNPTNPATFTTGYPPTFVDSTKKPSNVDISSMGFQNFAPGDDLPALMYNVGVLDLHGNVNISGVLYTPSFMEIENKQNGQIQYFKGTLIGGGGIYIENGTASTSIVSYDPGAIDKLATSGNKGKRIYATYWH